jgi:dimethylhistidine N-methyltransferase
MTIPSRTIPSRTIPSSVQSQVELYDLHPPLDDFQAEVLQGLQHPQKSISPKFLYDKRGAELFDAICTLDEYYLTRTETAILRTYAQDIADRMGNRVLVEFGSGSSQKVRILLDALLDANSHLPTYVGLDISKQHLQESCENLAAAYPGLRAIALCADYTQPLQLPDLPSLRHHRVGFFPGSSIGNLEPAEAVQFLQNAAALLGSGGSLLIGVDLKKSHTILEPAYDDAQGISAAFALNLLTRINRELGADFVLDQFGYSAVYNAIAGRIEMYLISLQSQTVHLKDVAISFEQGELLRTEYSYKYSILQFQQIAALAGFQPMQVWTDPDQLFSLHYLQLGD